MDSSGKAPSKNIDCSAEGDVRWAAAGLIKSLIRARITQEPEFLSRSDRERWNVENATLETRSCAYLLCQVRSLQKQFDLQYPKTVDSVSDPKGAAHADCLDNLIEQVAAFIQGDLDQLIGNANRGEQLDWDAVAKWELLPDIRDALDKLPRKDNTGDRGEGLPVGQDQNVFCRQEHGWRIKFGSEDGNVYGDLAGFFYIYELLRHPERSFHGLELRDAKKRCKSAGVLSSTLSPQELDESASSSDSSSPHFAHDDGSSPDDQARREYWKEIQRIEKELKKAKGNRNRAEISKLEKEKKLLRRVMGKTTLVKTAKNAHRTVKLGIELALKKFPQDSALSLHFQKALRLTPVFCYQPEPPVDWKL